LKNSVPHEFNTNSTQPILGQKEKPLKPFGFNGFDGGDKQDRTADLLNAIVPTLCKQCHKIQLHGQNSTYLLLL